ncbi:hypothetical protein [Pedobacter sp.]
MKNQALSKNIFLASIGLLIYFTFAFTGLVAKLDFAIIGAIYELITIPLILVVVALFAFATFQLLVKKKANFYNVASSVITMSIIVLMFVIQ